MIRIAVTGGPASGKSSACQVMQSLGAFILSSDDVVHRLLTLPSNIQHISDICGSHVLVKGNIDRKLVAQIVFSDQKKLTKLEELLHPQALAEIKKNFAKVEKSAQFEAFVVEVPLLYEAGWEPYFDKVLALKADPKVCETRYCESRRAPSDFERRRERQLAESEKLNRADIQIENNGSLEDLEQKITEAYHHLLN